jgi:hypothetical protein
LVLAGLIFLNDRKPASFNLRKILYVIVHQGERLIFSNLFTPLTDPGPVMPSMPVRPNGPNRFAPPSAVAAQINTPWYPRQQRKGGSVFSGVKPRRTAKAERRRPFGPRKGNQNALRFGFRSLG